MFTTRISLFTVLGFEVKVDLSWLFLAVLVTWTLAEFIFPPSYPGLSPATYWWMGLVGMFGLFFSIVFHELSHSLVAREHGLAMGGITLFVFGGIAEMKDEPAGPRPEFLMAVAGPIASIVLAGAFYSLHLAAASLGWPTWLEGALWYLGLINLILAVFNLVPAFPLDGGRMLRAVLWGWKGNLLWATRIAARIGAGFGIFLVVLGALNVITGNYIGGMWWFLIGLFVRGAANMSYQQLVVREAFAGVPVRRVMDENPVSVSPAMSVADLEDRFYRHRLTAFPVVEDSALVGCATVRDVRQLARERWPATAVRDIMKPCSGDNTIGPEEDALSAFQTMSRTGNRRLVVAEGGRLVGTVSMRDMLEFLSIKLDLEGDEGGPFIRAMREGGERLPPRRN
jgi:Zn-dependent protease